MNTHVHTTLGMTIVPYVVRYMNAFYANMLAFANSFFCNVTPVTFNLIYIFESLYVCMFVCLYVCMFVCAI